MQEKKERILKIEYQRVLGKAVSIRTWQRVLKRLEIQDDQLEAAPIVRSYGKLKRHRKVVDLIGASNMVWLSENTPNLYCTGRQLFEALRRLNPPLSLATIYRWGKEIGVEFSMSKNYLPSELNAWVERVLISGRWKKNGISKEGNRK